MLVLITCLIVDFATCIIKKEIEDEFIGLTTDYLTCFWNLDQWSLLQDPFTIYKHVEKVAFVILVIGNKTFFNIRVINEENIN